MVQDLDRIKRNVAKMANMGAPEEDIDGYISSEGVTIEDVRNYRPQPEEPLYGGGFTSGLRAAQAGAADVALLGGADEMKASMQAAARSAVDPNVNYDQAYDHFLNQSRQQASELQEQNKLAYGAGQGGGGIAAALSGTGLARGGAVIASKVAPNVTRALQGASIPYGQQLGAVGLGGASGGVYGFGTGQGGAEERIKKAFEFGPWGAAGGLVGVGATSAARRIAPYFLDSPLVQKALRKFGKEEPTDVIAKEVDPEETIQSLITKQEEIVPVEDGEKAFGKVSKQLKKDFGEEYQTALEAYKKGDISLSELYGKRTSSLAQGAAVFPSGRAVTEGFFEPKVSGSYDRILKNVRENVSGVDSYYTTAEDLINAGRAKASPLYKEAYERSISDTGILKTAEIQDALKRAYKTYPTDLADSSPDSIKALDYAKRVLDDDIGKAKRAGENNFVRSRTQIKNELLEKMDSASPSYAKARAVAGDYLSIDEAMEKGRNALKTDSELIAKEFKSLTDPEKQAYKIGLGKSIRDEVGKVAEGANPYRRILGSPEKQKRISSILSPTQYKNMEVGLEAEDRLFKLRNQVLGGSPTADKLEAQKLITSGAIDNIIDVPKKTMITGLSQMKNKFLSGMNDRTAAKVADILYETDPVKKLEIIDKFKMSKNFTPLEKETVERAYSLAADRYDSLRALGSITGGVTAPAILTGEE